MSDPVTLHGYSPTLGQPTTKQALPIHLNERFGMNYEAQHIFPTSGAAGALAHALRCVAGEGEVVITFAPYFPEYIPYVTGTGAELRVVPADTTSFQINFEKFEEMMSHPLLPSLSIHLTILPELFIQLRPLSILLHTSYRKAGIRSRNLPYYG